MTDPGALLAAERQQTEGQIASLVRDFEGIVEATELVSTDDEHDPEGSTIAVERAIAAGLLRDARHHLNEIERALARVDDGSYGRCAICGGSIAAERLAARPATPTCIDCAT